MVHLFALFIHQLPGADEQRDKKPAAAPLSRDEPFLRCLSHSRAVPPWSRGLDSMHMVVIYGGGGGEPVLYGCALSACEGAERELLGGGGTICLRQSGPRLSFSLSAALLRRCVTLFVQPYIVYKTRAWTLFYSGEEFQSAQLVCLFRWMWAQMKYFIRASRGFVTGR
jgi:hypothetical protein